MVPTKADVRLDRRLPRRTIKTMIDDLCSLASLIGPCPECGNGRLEAVSDGDPITLAVLSTCDRVHGGVLAHAHVGPCSTQVAHRLLGHRRHPHPRQPAGPEQRRHDRVGQTGPVDRRRKQSSARCTHRSPKGMATSLVTTVASPGAVRTQSGTDVEGGPIRIMQAQSGLDIIPRAECLRLLASRRLGRLGFVVGDQPMVLPLNYAIKGDIIVFRTGEGSKLDAAPRAKVAFEVDEIDVNSCSGWSVVVQGRAEEITDVEDWFQEEFRRAATPPWIPGATEHYLRIDPSWISGRRLPSTSADVSDVVDALHADDDSAGKST